MQVKPVKGYEGLYEVSEEGDVFSLRTGKKRKTQIDKGGYVTLILSKEGTVRSRFVHRLVAEAFIENPLGKAEINHRDFNKTNNHASNLEWVTGTENIAYQHKHVLWKFRKRPVIGVHETSQEIIKFESIKAAKRLGFHTGEIIECCRKPITKFGIRRIHKGYHWSYDISNT